MTQFAVDPQQLKALIEQALGTLAQSVSVSRDEVVVQAEATHCVQVAQVLRDAPGLQFEMAVDLCGVDYSQYQADGISPWEGKRFCAVTHLLSISLNQRVRLKVFAQSDDMPVLPTLTGVWNSLDWFEREAFDLYGIVFEGHSDLRRILTDYGFIGHPFRKDFPVSGHVEMRYDAEKKRVIYQPVTIEPRENTPRVVREDSYGGGVR
jgi:NADH-quinone oxidoreductase subunit C